MYRQCLFSNQISDHFNVKLYYLMGESNIKSKWLTINDKIYDNISTCSKLNNFDQIPKLQYPTTPRSQ